MNKMLLQMKRDFETLIPAFVERDHFIGLIL